MYVLHACMQQQNIYVCVQYTVTNINCDFAVTTWLWPKLHNDEN